MVDEPDLDEARPLGELLKRTRIHLPEVAVPLGLVGVGVAR